MRGRKRRHCQPLPSEEAVFLFVTSDATGLSLTAGLEEEPIKRVRCHGTAPPSLQEEETHVNKQQFFDQVCPRRGSPSQATSLLGKADNFMVFV